MSEIKDLDVEVPEESLERNRLPESEPIRTK